MANTIKESKGVTSQKDIVTGVRCPVCKNLMRQNEISVEIAFRHSRVLSRPVVVGFSRDMLRGEV